MAKVPPEVIRSIQDAVDIADVVARYVALKPSGSSLKGLCPFHEEKTPSFHVFPNSQRFKCFGCGEGGDVFQFLMRRDGIGFRDALEELGRSVNIALPTEEQSPADLERERRRGSARRALDFAAQFYRAVLPRPVAEPARRYLAERGFTAATLEAFGIGYAPDDYEAFSRYARSKGLSEQALLDAGLVRRRESGDAYDMFRGRIIFPIRDVAGRVIGFGARALGDAQPKYLNSPDGPLFHKGSELYGLDLAREAARRARRLLVVEGYTDVMHCRQAGIEEVVAGLGTALTPENANRLRRLGTPLLLVYDGDEAGRRAAERAADVLLAEGCPGRVALLEPGRDPAELLVERGREALEAILGNARDLWQYRVEGVLSRHDVRSLEGRAGAVHELLETVVRMSDPVRRDSAFRLVSERLGLPESTLRDQAQDLQRPSRSVAARGGEDAGGEEEVSPIWLRAEQDLLAAALTDETLWDRIADACPPSEFRVGSHRRIAGAIDDLRREGQSLSREALLARLADHDEAVRSLGRLEPGDEARVRALGHLERLSQNRRLRSAMEAGSLEAVLRARKGALEPGAKAENR